MKTVFLLPLAATTAILAGTAVTANVMSRRIPEQLAVPLSRIDLNIGGWTCPGDLELMAPTVRALAATSYLSRVYRKAGWDLDLFIAFYAQQRAGESMHSPKHCMPGAGWEIWRHDTALVPVNGSGVRINKYSIQKAGTRMLMFYWYQSKSRLFASEYLGKILLARDTILTGRTSGSIVRIMLPDAPGAAQEGVRFAARLVAEVQRCLTGGPAASANSSSRHMEEALRPTASAIVVKTDEQPHKYTAASPAE